MRRTRTMQTRGFTLVELMIAMAAGLILIASATELFTQALNATYVVSQRAEMQQNGRAAVGLLSQDISLAGAGLPTGGVQLPIGGPTNPIYGCDQTKCYVAGTAPAGIAYPSQHLDGIVPSPGAGIPLSAGGANTDVITIAYADTTASINQYKVTAFGPAGNSITLAQITPGPSVPALNDPAIGIKVGDLIMVTNGGSAIAEVTGVTSTVISFADLDALHINQSTAPSGNMNAISTPPPPGPPSTIVVPAVRILVITYYMDLNPGPDGIRYTADDLPPRLMRQVNGQTPTPVAENIADLQFSYDVSNSATIDASNIKDIIALGYAPSDIRKVNIASMSARSQMHGKPGFQGMDLSTSVSVRDMSFRDRYQ
jgi:prepilin-type N-terminal cleavage/methylation domain-containing protein